MTSECSVILCGNPNVGKSSIFNELTGMRQHTGNWSGKTVSCASGHFVWNDTRITLTDLPGCYSLHTVSQEEEIAREYLQHHADEVVVIVCDATCLERNLLLVLQVLQIAPRSILCLNLMDEARKKQIVIHTEQLSKQLDIPVVETCAHTGEGLETLKETILQLQHAAPPQRTALLRLKSSQELGQYTAGLASDIIQTESSSPHERDRRLDKIFTGKYTAFPIMLLLFFFLFYITISGANIPSQLLDDLFRGLESPLVQLLLFLHIPVPLTNLLVYGIYRVMTWVISVMLPPMAIFFPLFTILEDLGYLPRIAFNLDRCFYRCHACGKQALCMCMGLGCNAVGVTGCRIIDSSRERLLAILTNTFTPCNGRFPTLILLCTLFWAWGTPNPFSTITAAASLAILLGLSILITLLCSRLLSATLLRGIPSAYTLELPPYRRPRITKILIRTFWDRTLRVLWRGIGVAAPAGILIWGLANISLGEQTLMQHAVTFLDPFAGWFGLDGAILLAFLLGMPANEIVIPILLMCYLEGGTLMELPDASAYRVLFLAQGWDYNRLICVLLFTLFHWPCTTTLLTIKKETNSPKWTAVSFLLPTGVGMILCFLVHHILLWLGIQ